MSPATKLLKTLKVLNKYNRTQNLSAQTIDECRYTVKFLSYANKKHIQIIIPPINEGNPPSKRDFL